VLNRVCDIGVAVVVAEGAFPARVAVAGVLSRAVPTEGGEVPREGGERGGVLPFSLSLVLRRSLSTSTDVVGDD